MSSSSGDVDVSFLEINGIVYNFYHIIKNDNLNVDVQLAKKLAAKALGLMDKYSSLHPQYQLLIDYCRMYDKGSKYNDLWVHEVNERNNQIKLKSKHHYSDKGAFDAIKKGAIASVIQGSYLLLKLKDLTRFQTTQPVNMKQFIDNRYMEYFFLEFIINFYQLYWPVSEDSDELSQSGSFVNLSNNSISADPLRSMQSIYKKVTFYYNKNESLFREENGDITAEFSYYWMIKWLNILALFKQLKYHECLQEVETMISNESDRYQLLELLEKTPILKSSILVVFAFSAILAKPFKDLTLIDTDFQPLMDSFVISEDNIEFSIYSDILVPLSELRLREVKNIFKNTEYISKLSSSIGHILPEPVNKLSPGFLDYLMQMIDFKSFLLLISMTKQIKRRKMMSLLGYDENEDIGPISNNLIVLISSLGLGELGIGYNVQGDYYYNNEDNNKEILLTNEIDNLTEMLESESMAKLLRAVLIEKFLN